MHIKVVLYNKEVKGHLMGKRWWVGVIRNRSSEEVWPVLVPWRVGGE